jgi:hypothetical protein
LHLLEERKLAHSSCNVACSAFEFFYRVTLKRRDTQFVCRGRRCQRSCRRSCRVELELPRFRGRFSAWLSSGLWGWICVPVHG